MDDLIYQHIRNLSWDLLIDSHAKELPVRITPIAKLYDCSKYIDYDKSRYDNTLLISQYILNKFGLNLHSQCPNYLLRDY